MTELAPPSKNHELEDPGAHELGGHSNSRYSLSNANACQEQNEDDSDVFADAQEGQQTSTSGSSSPIPVTRVEKVPLPFSNPVRNPDNLRSTNAQIMAKYPGLKLTTCEPKTPCLTKSRLYPRVRMANQAQG